jgi:protocatechuate 3,4-dioxygenase beta subunit
VATKRATLQFLLALTIATSSAQAQKDLKTAKEDLSTISGTVVKMAGSAPLRKGRVLLISTDDKTRRVAAITDVAGKFTLKEIEPGSYRLSVSRTGFVTEQYGRRKPGGPGAILTLRPKQEMKLEFRMIPSGVISGKILDEDGEPLAGASVYASKQSYSEGKRTLMAAWQAETNDLGEYRIYGLAPGRYFVSSTYSRFGRTFSDETLSADVQSSTANASAEGYAKMYYPGTTEPGKAEAIVIKPGEEVSSIEMLLRPVTVHRVRGHLYNQITNKPGTGTSLYLVPNNKANQEWDSTHSSEVRKMDGSFEISDVAPGSYVLAAFWGDEGKFYSAQQVLEVGDADLEGVALTITPGTTINGHIVWAGRPSMEKDELSVSALPVGVGLGYQGPSRVSRENSFTLRNIGEGHFRAEVSGQSKDCYLKEVHYGQADGLKNGFTVTKGEAGNLEIAISSQGARVQGTVMDANGLPLAGVAVALVPDAPRRDEFRLYKTENTDQYGHFDLRGIAPGEYRVFSWEEVEQDAWQDGDFLKPFENKGEHVILNDDDKKEVQVTVISTKNEEEVRP